VARRDDSHDEVTALKRRLTEQRQELARKLRDNERIWAGFRAIEVRMIGAESLAGLVEVLATALPQRFPHVEAASLTLLDPEFEMKRLVAGHAPAAAALHDVEPEWLRAQFSGTARPWLGAATPPVSAVAFPDLRPPPRSLALAPLVLHGQIIGSLNQASRDPDHFRPGTATDLLEHLAAVTAMCLDNAVSRERLKRDGLTDALTGVANRRFFERRLREELSAWQRRAGPLACLLVDLDHFKQLNDRHGHQTGDRALCAVAGVLSAGLRGCDVLARYGGEEFVLLLPGTDLVAALEVAERLRAQIAALVLGDGAAGAPQVTASIGVACLASGATPAVEPGEWLVAQADAALYAAKQAGRDRVSDGAGRARAADLAPG